MYVWTHIILAIYICMVLILPTGSFHFRGLIAYTVGDVTRVRVLSRLPSARNPSYGFCDPEGSIFMLKCLLLTNSCETFFEYISSDFYYIILFI